MTIEEYLVLNNPREVAAILEANGSRKIDKKNILEVINRFTEKKGDYAYEQLGRVDTPYRRLILSLPMTEIQEKKSGCSGCGGSCGGEKKSNCCGSGVDGEKTQLTSEKDASIAPAIKIAEAPAASQQPTVLVQNPTGDKKDNSNLMVAGLMLLGVITVAVLVRLK